jgi:geranylgeranyl diphosphate synthase type II
MKKKLEEFQRQSIPQIEKFLKDVVKAKKPLTIYEPSRYILGAGGKRMRPMLVLLACKAVGGTPLQALPAAVALADR